MLRIRISSGRGVQHYVIKFVRDLRLVGGFLRVLRFITDITGILLKVALNTKIQPTNQATLQTFLLCVRQIAFFM